MNLAAVMVFGLFVGLLAAIGALVSGHGLLASFGFYVLFGVGGVMAAAVANWLGNSFPAGLPKPDKADPRHSGADEPAE